MKKALTFAVILVSLFLCSCSNKNFSADVIGGADRASSVYVTKTGEESNIKNEENKNTQKTGIRLVRVNGFLYYDTGKESNVSGRCGVMDGHITGTDTETEIPVEDNTANFDIDCDYQLGFEKDTIELASDGKWLVFTKADSEKDFDKYSFCFKLTGSLPNAAAQSELIVFTNDVNISFEDVWKPMLSSYYDPEDENRSDFALISWETM